MHAGLAVSTTVGRSFGFRHSATPQQVGSAGSPAARSGHVCSARSYASEEPKPATVH
jgi:hypothetical protein